MGTAIEHCPGWRHVLLSEPSSVEGMVELVERMARVLRPGMWAALETCPGGFSPSGVLWLPFSGENGGVFAEGQQGKAGESRKVSVLGWMRL
jgi:hypothetical protein